MPDRITLRSAESVSNNTFKSDYFANKGLDDSVVYVDPLLSTPLCEEENEGEANAVIEILKALLEEGYNASDIAVITPFRKQVRLIRSKAYEVIDREKLPLIDTVERLQGLDVKCIILSFTSSSNGYIKDIVGFLFNRNRLNVMISRAKTKVVILGSEIIQKKIKKILNDETN